jgi:8-oxo-dGTP diphosphatase
VIIEPPDIQIVHIMNRKSEDERIDFFIAVSHWVGEVTNNEPQKCDDLSWVTIDSLPHNIIPYVKHAIENYQASVYYSEFGWQ